MRTQIQPQEGKNGKDIKNIPVVCKHCKSKNFTKEGYRNTQNRGKIQKYLCKDCKKYFTSDNGFYRMRNSEKKITMSVDMYLSNLSSRKMRNQLKRHFDHKISHVSILDWVRTYVIKVHKLIDKLKPKLSGKFYADETEIPRGCNTKKKGGDKFWCSVDWDTRYINATFYSPENQSVDEAVRFLKKTNKHGKPKFIQTDAAQFYPRAMRKVFYSNKLGLKKELTVEHRIQNVGKTGKHNVRIETVFSKIKDRVDDFRGIKALWSAPILLAGIVLQHNFIENHTTTGVRPCELADINVETGVNRWLGLIRMASI